MNEESVTINEKNVDMDKVTSCPSSVTKVSVQEGSHGQMGEESAIQSARGDVCRISQGVFYGHAGTRVFSSG